MNTHSESHFPKFLELKEHIDHEIAEVYFYKDFVVVEAKEGVNISYSSGFSLLLKGLKLLGTRPWIYVSHRVNSYSFVPTDYKYLNNVPTLKGMVIVCPEDAHEKTTTLEKKFLKKPYIVTPSFEEAYAWGKEILGK